MRRVLLAALLLWPSLASAQNWASTKAQQQFKLALTNATFFGVPRYTTVALPTCNAANTGAVAWNTTTASLYACNGSAWGATGGGTSLTGVTDITFANAGVIRTGTTAANTVLFQAYDNDTGPAYVTMATLTAGNTPSFTLRDDFTWVVGATDVTKRARWEVDGFTASNDRVFTLPGLTGNDTIATLATSNVYTGARQDFPTGSVGTPSITFGTAGSGLFGASNYVATSTNFLQPSTLAGYYLNAVGATGPVWLWSTTLTPDGSFLATGSANNTHHVSEQADVVYDFNNCDAGTAAATDPGTCHHSSVQDTTQYTVVRAGVIASKAVKTLTESSATSIFNIPITTLTGTGGEFNYCVIAADASNVQHRCGRIKWNAVNVADTETCNMTAVAGTTDASITELEDGSGGGAISSGTLTYAVTCAGATNSVTVSINAVSSLTQTTLQAEYSVLMTGRGQVARQ